MMAFLLEAYDEDEAPNTKGGVDKRMVLRLDPRLAPVKAAVLPLSRNADLSPKARDLAAQLRKHWNVEFDDAQAIGRRYRRQDEIGTPVLHHRRLRHDQGVTVRFRDDGSEWSAWTPYRLSSASASPASDHRAVARWSPGRPMRCPQAPAADSVGVAGAVASAHAEVRLRLRRGQPRPEGPPRRQGREPRRDDQPRAARSARVHHHDGGLSVRVPDDEGTDPAAEPSRRGEATHLAKPRAG